MPTYEMFWDCSTCGTTKLLGKTHRHCPNCGAVQDPTARYFPPEGEEVEVRDHVFYGVDWSCERCDTPNSAAASHCVNCGDARDGREHDVARRADVTAGQQAGRLTEPLPRPRADPGPARDPAPFDDDVVEHATIAGISVVTLSMVVAALSLTCAGLLVFSWFWTTPTVVNVTGHSWERAVLIDKLAARSDSAWCDSMPSDAYSVSRSRKQRSTKRVPDGETCRTVKRDNGDGTYSSRRQCSTNYRSEPVYDDHCRYTVDRWGHARTVKATGKSLGTAPHWPSYQVTDCARLGCTRVGGRRQSYWVHMVDGDGEEQVCDYAQATWQRMAVGSRWDAKKRVVWDNLVCSGLQPKGAP